MLYILDWDGTLSDSTDRIAGCIKDAAKEVGLPDLSKPEIKHIIGLGMREAVEHLYPEASEKQILALAETYKRLFIERDQQPSAFYSGVMETLTSLKARNARLAIATGKNRIGLDRILRRVNLHDFFDYSRCADETQSKPHPLMIDELVDEAGVLKSEAVMVGDTEWDMVMADNAGVRKVAVDYGAHARDRLVATQPDMIISAFSQLLDWRW